MFFLVPRTLTYVTHTRTHTHTHTHTHVDAHQVKNLKSQLYSYSYVITLVASWLLRIATCGGSCWRGTAGRPCPPKPWHTHKYSNKHTHASRPHRTHPHTRTHIVCELSRRPFLQECACGLRVICCSNLVEEICQKTWKETYIYTSMYTHVRAIFNKYLVHLWIRSMYMCISFVNIVSWCAEHICVYDWYTLRHIHTHTCYVHMYAHMHTNMYPRVCMHTYTPVFIHISTPLYIHMHIYIYIYIIQYIPRSLVNTLNAYIYISYVYIVWWCTACICIYDWYTLRYASINTSFMRWCCGAAPRSCMDRFSSSNMRCRSLVFRDIDARSSCVRVCVCICINTPKFNQTITRGDR